jgi:hypothetical protein
MDRTRAQWIAHVRNGSHTCYFEQPVCQDARWNMRERRGPVNARGIGQPGVPRHAAQRAQHGEPCARRIDLEIHPPP